MTNIQLITFMAVITTMFLTVIGIGVFFFARWSKREHESGRKFIDAHLAEVTRGRTESEDRGEE